MILVFCDNDSCIHNRSGCCYSDVISIEVKLGEFQSGERLRYPTCQDCKEEDDEDDGDA